MTQIINEGQIKPSEIVGYLGQYFRPEFSVEYAMANLVRAFPALLQKERCPNCDASMVGYVFKFDYHNARLLQVMGENFLNRMAKGLPFTEANKHHVVQLPMSDACRHRTTMASKLGLVAKLKGPKSTGLWVITRRGFAALRGEEVPKKVTVWRDHIQERTDELTTIYDALAEKGGDVPDDPHDPNPYVIYAGVNQGQLY